MDILCREDGGAVIQRKESRRVQSHRQIPVRNLCGGDRCYRGVQLTSGLCVTGDEPHPVWKCSRRLGAAERVGEASEPLGARCPGRHLVPGGPKLSRFTPCLSRSPGTAVRMAADLSRACCPPGGGTEHGATPGTEQGLRHLPHVLGSPAGRCGAPTLAATCPPRAQASRASSVLPRCPGVSTSPRPPRPGPRPAFPHTVSAGPGPRLSGWGGADAPGAGDGRLIQRVDDGVTGLCEEERSFWPLHLVLCTHVLCTLLY